MTNLAEPSLKNQLDSQQELIKNPEPGSPSKSLFQKFRDRRALKKSEKAKRNEYWNKMNSMDASKRDEILEEETNIMRKKVTNANNKYIFPGFFVYIYLMAMWEFGFDRRKRDGSQPCYGFFDYRRNLYCWRNILESLEIWFDNDDILLSEKCNLYAEKFGGSAPEYTIIVEPLKILIQPEYDITQGWRLRKAKGFDMFLKLVGVDSHKLSHNNMELVAWTNKPLTEVDSYLSIFGEKRHRILMKENNTYKLGLLEMDLLSGKLPKSVEYKNIELLGRDVRKVIFVDTEENVRRTNLHDRHGGNVLIVPEMVKNGIKNEDTIVELLAFLLLITKELKIPDVRPVVGYYNDFGENWLEEFKNDRSFIFEEAERQGVDISRFKDMHTETA